VTKDNPEFSSLCVIKVSAVSGTWVRWTRRKAESEEFWRTTRHRGCKDMVFGRGLLRICLLLLHALVSVYQEWTPFGSFWLNFAVMIPPQPRFLGDFTEELALHTNQTIGGLINATFRLQKSLSPFKHSWRTRFVSLSEYARIHLFAFGSQGVASSLVAYFTRTVLQLTLRRRRVWDSWRSAVARSFYRTLC
jgi:hypothetical protein